MPLHHRVLAAAYYPLKLAKTLGKPLGLAASQRLRVLLYHDIDPSDQIHFAAQLRWLARSWKFVSAAQFAAMMSGEAPVVGSNLLLTFDDGYASNRAIAEQVLNPMGIKALFFVVSDFIALQERDAARRFIADKIFPGLHAGKLPAHYGNMSWTDLEALLEQGHSIGGHTQTHVRLSQLDSTADLEREIVASADMLARRLGTPIEHFAYTFGDLASFSPRALEIAQRRFRFVHSGLRGDNVGQRSPLVRRDAVTARDSMALLGSLVEGAADFRYPQSAVMRKFHGER